MALPPSVGRLPSAREHAVTEGALLAYDPGQAVNPRALARAAVPAGRGGHARGCLLAGRAVHLEFFQRTMLTSDVAVCCCPTGSERHRAQHD